LYTPCLKSLLYTRRVICAWKKTTRTEFSFSRATGGWPCAQQQSRSRGAHRRCVRPRNCQRESSRRVSLGGMAKWSLSAYGERLPVPSGAAHRMTEQRWEEPAPMFEFVTLPLALARESEHNPGDIIRRRLDTRGNRQLPELFFFSRYASKPSISPSAPASSSGR
jgi:hypothetical protein